MKRLKQTLSVVAKSPRSRGRVGIRRHAHRINAMLGRQRIPTPIWVLLYATPWIRGDLCTTEPVNGTKLSEQFALVTREAGPFARWGVRTTDEHATVRGRVLRALRKLDEEEALLLLLVLIAARARPMTWSDVVYTAWWRPIAFA